jgi:putative tryptophan/tyrosine transport system substrate-binding protein
MAIHLGRRHFITLLGGGTFAWPLVARAQQPNRVRRIGVLMSLSPSDAEAPIRLAGFLQKLQELGWTDRRNIRIDYRLADSSGVQTAAAALVALAPDILLVNGAAPLKAVQQATRTIPIVFENVIDPVGQSFVLSLAHPGGNITGFTNVESEMGGKWLQLLKQVSPSVTGVAVIGATTLSGGAGIEASIRAVASSLGVLRLTVIPVTAEVFSEMESLASG